MLNSYYQLVKPRMVVMNVIVAAAAFIFASPATISWDVLAVMASGLGFVVASACVFNNVADRKLDAKMERTKSRAVAAGHIAPLHALLFGAALLLAGVALLYLYTNLLALGVAWLGFVVYVFAYTPLKPKSALALYVGAVAGATPPVVGYAAAAGVLDYYALALFAVLFLWQIPHFLAIARYRFGDYTAGGVPLLVAEPANEAERQRARKVFYVSLVVLVLFCGALILQRWIR